MEYLKDYVGIHLRFGDYLSIENKRLLGELSVDFYKNSLDFFRIKNENLKVIVFTDDAEAASLKMKTIPNLTLTYAKDYCGGIYEEFCLLTYLPHKIISNSTFSWWAGYLSHTDATVIAPDPMSLEQLNGNACSPRFKLLPAKYLTE
jgi:hypothetical protein